MSGHSIIGISGAFVSVVFLSGCMLMSEPYKDVRYYDLSVPAPASPEAVRVSILPVRDEAATKYRMLFRKNNNTLVVDDYAKWTQPPGLMITRYLESFFSRSDSNSGSASEESLDLSISGAIFAFEADLESKEVTLGVKYEIRRADGNKLLLSGARTFKEKVDDFSGEKLASAMSVCASRYAEFLKKEIDRLYPEEIAELQKFKAEKLANDEKEREAAKRKEKDLAEQRKNLQARDEARTKAAIERAAAEKVGAELEKQRAELELQKLKDNSGAPQNSENKK